MQHRRIRTGPQINILLLRDGTDGREAMVDWRGSDDDRPMRVPDRLHSLPAFLEL